MRFDHDGKLLCSCNMLYNRGFPCGHIWKVNCYLEKNDLSLIRIVERWTKEYSSNFQLSLQISEKIATSSFQSIEEHKTSIQKNQGPEVPSNMISTNIGPKINSQETIPKPENLIMMQTRAQKRKANPVALDDHEKGIARLSLESTAKMIISKRNFS